MDHPFFMPPFPEGVSPQNSEVYEIALIIAEYDLYFLITLKRPASPDDFGYNYFDLCDQLSWHGHDIEISQKDSRCPT